MARQHPNSYHDDFDDDDDFPVALDSGVDDLDDYPMRRGPRPRHDEALRTKKNTQEEVVWQDKPSWQGMIGWYIKAFLVGILVLLVLYVLKSMDVIGSFLFVLGALVVVGSYFSVGYMVRSVTSYTLTNKRIIVRFGILNRQIQKTSLKRVQNTTVEQKLWERVLNVGSIDIDTAGYNVEDTAARPYLMIHGIRHPGKVASLIDMHAWDDDPYE